jgi:hypothetical protein
MALKGSLQDFYFTQILNIIHLAQKTGQLAVEGPAGAGSVYFREGRLACTQLEGEDDSLPNILLASGKITQGRYRILKERSDGMPDIELGLVMVNANLVSQEDILSSYQAFYTSSLRRMFTWTEGAFRFEPDVELPEGHIAVRMDLENLIMEGTRQLQEQDRLLDEIPSLQMALRFTGHPGSMLRRLNLSPEEWKVVRYLDQAGSLEEIARLGSLDEMQVRRAVFSLVQAGLVELVRPAGVPVPNVGPILPGKSEKETVSVLNRLIERIRSI